MFRFHPIMTSHVLKTYISFVRFSDFLMIAKKSLIFAKCTNFRISNCKLFYLDFWCVAEAFKQKCISYQKFGCSNDWMLWALRVNVNVNVFWPNNKARTKCLITFTPNFECLRTVSIRLRKNRLICAFKDNVWINLLQTTAKCFQYWSEYRCVLLKLAGFCFTNLTNSISNHLKFDI